MKDNVRLNTTTNVTHATNATKIIPIKVLAEVADKLHTKEHRCSVIDRDLQKRCPITACMWHSKKENGCCQDVTNINSYAYYRALDASKVDNLSKKAVLQIQCTTLLYKYLEFIVELEERIGQLPKKKEANGIAFESYLYKFPFQLEVDDKWTQNRLAIAMEKRAFNKFSSRKGLQISITLNQLMGMNETQFDTALQRREGLYLGKTIRKIIKGAL